MVGASTKLGDTACNTKHNIGSPARSAEIRWKSARRADRYAPSIATSAIYFFLSQTRNWLSRKVSKQKAWNDPELWSTWVGCSCTGLELKRIAASHPAALRCYGFSFLPSHAFFQPECATADFESEFRGRVRVLEWFFSTLKLVSPPPHLPSLGAGRCLKYPGNYSVGRVALDEGAFQPVHHRQPTGTPEAARLQGQAWTSWLTRLT